MIYLAFTTEAEAISANEKIYANMLRSKIGDKKAINIETGAELSVARASDTTLTKDGVENREYPIFGLKNGVENREDGFTIAYSTIIEIDGKWAIPKPQDIYDLPTDSYSESPLLDGVEGYEQIIK